MSGALRFSAAAVVLDDAGRVLLVHHAYDLRRWSLPGGALDAAETPHGAVVRETLEETGCTLTVDRALGTYHFVYADGRPAQIGYGFVGSITGEPSVQDPREIEALGWFDPVALPEPLTNFVRIAVPDALAGRFCGVRRVEVR